MRIDVGDERTREWLEGMKANEPQTLRQQHPVVEAIAAGEIDVALVNHYYLYELERERGTLPVENHFFRPGDPGSLRERGRGGRDRGQRQPGAAERFVEYVLSRRGQQYFAEKTAEYPLAAGVKPGEDLRPLDEVHGPFIDLGMLGEKLPSTLEMIDAAGLNN